VGAPVGPVEGEDRLTPTKRNLGVVLKVHVPGVQIATLYSELRG